MIKKLYIIPILLLAFISVRAQEYGQQESIMEHLRSNKGKDGSVRIFQSSQLDSLLSRNLKSTAAKIETNGTSAFITSRGYRVQIFSGNNQRESKSEAYAKEEQIKQLFPLLDTYVSFNSPFWKLRIGNFRTSEEAHAKLRELKLAFPKWKEMIIVNDQVRFPINDPYLP